MFKVVGIERMDYVSKKTNSRVQGYRFYVEEENNRVVGVKASNIYVNDKIFAEHFSNVSVNDFIDVYYNFNKQIIGCNVYKNND